MPAPIEAAAVAVDAPQRINVQEVDSIIREAIDTVVGGSVFQHAKLHAWTDAILDCCVKQLAALNRPFKFVTNVNVGQKEGAGMHVTSATVWDEATDGKASVHWTNAAGVLVLAVVYWVAM